MNIHMPMLGTYVVAVSGGVDSVVLLHALRSRPDLRLVVAHFDHGIRPESRDDRLFVEQLAKTYKLPFVYKRVELGVGASEAAARKARYDFLQKVQRSSNARAIITAHHEDDVLETAIINMLRGTGRKGLTALQSTTSIERPLLKVSKGAIIDYANEHHLVWREDSTNIDERYLRNYVRHKILVRFGDSDRQKLLTIIDSVAQTNRQLEDLLVNELHLQSTAGQLDRKSFIMLPHAVALEVLASWLRSKYVRNFNRKMLDRLVVAAKTAPAGRVFPVVDGHSMSVHRDYLALLMPER